MYTFLNQWVIFELSYSWAILTHFEAVKLSPPRKGFLHRQYCQSKSKVFAVNRPTKIEQLFSTSYFLLFVIAMRHPALWTALMVE
jgi:hypothetical protein